MITDNSWIKLPRDFANWNWYKNTNMVHLYLYLIIHANLKQGVSFDVKIKRGEIMISLSKLSSDTNLSVKILRNCLDKLERSKEIEYRKLKHGRIIIMLNYDNFQPCGIDETVQDWIKFYRKIEQWKWYSSPSMVHLLVHFLIKAKPVSIGNDYVFQLETSYNLLNRETGMTIQVIRTCIKKMQSDGVIKFMPSASNLSSTITICNYGNYQATKQLMDTMRENIGVNFENAQKPTRQIDNSSSCIPIGYEITEIEEGTTRAQQGHDLGTIEEKVGIDFENVQKPTRQIISSNNCISTSYKTIETKEGTTRARLGHNKGTTRAQQGHDLGTTWATIKEYKNIRNKERKIFINNDVDARAQEKDFVFSEEEKDEQKENLQKKVGNEDFKKSLEGDSVWLSAIIKSYKLRSKEDVISLLDEFELHLVCRGNEGHKDLRDYKSHFCDWIKVRNGKSQSVPAANKKNGERWEGEKFVPKSSKGGIYEHF